MCGIVGYVQTSIVGPEVDAQYQQALADLLYVDTLRGFDSTGVACIPMDRRRKSILLKRAVPGFAFIDLDEYKDVLKAQINPGIFIGHNRAATRGLVTEDNAHPFVAEHITLVHNGSINNMWELASGTHSQVDSCHIAHAIAKHGAAATLPKIDGPAALVWYNSIEHSVNMALTEGRSIRWIFDKHGTCWFGSEREMLFAILVRNGIETKGEFWLMPNHEHFKWELSDASELPGKLTRYKFPEFVPLWKKNQLEWEQKRREENLLKGDSNLGEAETKKSWSCRSISAASMLESGTSTNDQSKRDEPLSKRKIAKIDKKLDAYDLAVGDEITCTRLSWNPSKNNPNVGDIYCMWPEKRMKVVLADMHKTVWDRQNGGQYKVHVYNILQELVPAEGRHRPVLYAKLKSYQLREMVQGPGGTLITKDEFKQSAASGCLWCPKPVEVADHEIVEWVNGSPLCKICSINMNTSSRLVN